MQRAPSLRQEVIVNMATLGQLKQRLQQAKREVGSSQARGSRINVTSRKNIQIASNVGRDDAVEHASAVQVAPIHQDGSDR